MKKYILVSLMVLFSVNCFCQDSKWEKTLQKNTIENYQKFIEKYPDSEYVLVAKQKISDLEFAHAKEINSIESYQKFIDKYPDSEHISYANTMLIELEFAHAKEINSIESYQKFIDKYPDSEHISYANTMLIELEFAHAKDLNTILAYKNFLNKYPNSAYEKNVLNRIAAIAYQKAKENNTDRAYNEFIEKHPNNKFSAIAKSDLLMKSAKSIILNGENRESVLGVCSDLDALGAEIERICFPEYNSKYAAAFYVRAASLYETSGDFRLKLDTTFIYQYKKAGYLYSRASYECIHLEEQAFFREATAYLQSSNNNDVSQEQKIQDFEKKYAESIALVELSKNYFYDKSIDIFKKAGLTKQAEWMLNSGKIERFEFNEIIE